MTDPKEHPIPFSGPMVRAILEGRKTQTRRVMIPQPTGNSVTWGCRAGHGFGFFFDGEDFRKSKYGQPGDRLWIRERMRVIEVVDYGSKVSAVRVRYEADGAESDFIAYPDRLEGAPVVGKCLAYGGFREASRILLKITDVRIERLHEICQPDAIAEGITATKYGCHRHNGIGGCVTLVEGFAALWDSINTKRGHAWGSNPWVWAVSFKRVADG